MISTSSSKTFFKIVAKVPKGVWIGGALIPVAIAIIALAGGGVATGLFFSQVGWIAFTGAGGGVTVATVCVGMAILIVVGGSLSKRKKARDSVSIKEGASNIGVTEKGAHQRVNAKQTLAVQREAYLEEHDLTSCKAYSIFTGSIEKGEKLKEIHQLLQGETFDKSQEWALGIMMGAVVGSSVGTPFKNFDYTKEGLVVEGEFGMSPKGDVGLSRQSSFINKAGQWTEHVTSGLCLADILIEYGSIDEKQFLWALADAKVYGYNEPQGYPIAFWGEVGKVLREFKTKGLKRSATGRLKPKAKDSNSISNAPLVRLGPVVIAARSQEEALALAKQQTCVTHFCKETVACAQLLAYLLYQGRVCQERAVKKRKQALFDSLSSFSCDDLKVCRLAESSSGKSVRKSQATWNWKSDAFTYNSERLAVTPMVIGKQSMDGLAMALHCVYTTDSFKEAVIKAGTHGGDADTVGAITGQLAGAIYGYSGIPKFWKEAVYAWDTRKEIPARAIFLLT